MAQLKSRMWPNHLPIWLLKIAINVWPPFLGAGIRVRTISPDYRYVEVVMKLSWFNKNYVGTHFGGSMFAMTDPFYMLMLIKNLGRGYIVWDKAAQIEFKKVGRGRLHAIFRFSEAELQTIRQHVNQHEKWVFDKTVDIVNQEGEIVASVVKHLYVRKKS